MAGRNHGGARKLGAEGQRIAVETHQIVDEQKQAADPGGELTRRQHEVADIRDGLRTGADSLGALLVEPPRQVAKPSSLRTSRTAVALSGVPCSFNA
jgi:hypothetical protein